MGREGGRERDGEGKGGIKGRLREGGVSVLYHDVITTRMHQNNSNFIVKSIRTLSVPCRLLLSSTS